MYQITLFYLIDLVLEHPLSSEKHKYLSNQVNNIWMKITKRLGYNDDVANIHSQTICIVTESTNNSIKDEK